MPDLVVKNPDLLFRFCSACSGLIEIRDSVWEVGLRAVIVLGLDIHRARRRVSFGCFQVERTQLVRGGYMLVEETLGLTPEDAGMDRLPGKLWMPPASKLAEHRRDWLG